MTDETSQSIATEVELALDQPSGPPIDLTHLYRQWEAFNWSAYSLDFAADHVDWHERFTPTQRRAARWNYALFLHGEEAVARTLAPFISAAPTHEQRIFLSTQIVDEARHHVFFSRFLREVAGDGHDYASALEATRLNLTRGYRLVFGALDSLADNLRRHPRDLTLYARGIMLYHIIIESTLARAGQHFIQSYLASHQLLPGFSAGIRHVARDEARHMAFGVRVLSDLVARSPRIRHAVIAELDQVLPWAITLFSPPDLDEEYVRVFGFEMLDIFSFGLRSLATKLQRIGIAPGEVAALVQTGADDQPPEEQARRALTLIRAGVLGDAVPLRLTDEVLAVLFDGAARVANLRGPRALPGPVEWAFTDSAPWHLRPEHGRVLAHQGSAADPTLTLRCSASDWARIAGRKMDARWAVLTRRLKLEGDLKLALRLPALLGA